MITRPSEYKHNNNSMAFVDEENVRGGRRVVSDLTELYALSSIILDKLKDNITIVRVNSEDKDYRLIDKNIANTEQGWVVNSAISPPEIQVSLNEPTDSNIKLWGKLPLSSDLDILRQIRDASSPGILDTLWAENKDPYTQWWDSNEEAGVLWGNNPFLDFIASKIPNFTIPPISQRDGTKCYGIYISYLNLPKLIGPLDKLNDLLLLVCFSCELTDVNLQGCFKLQVLNISNNNLQNISSLTSKNSITDYDFTQNYLPTSELNRLRALGFTDESSLLPQKMTDLDVLRSIRDANPSSQLPALWADSEDPYTQWEGVSWDGNKVSYLQIDNLNISNLDNVNKLTALSTLSCYGNPISNLNLLGLNLGGLFCNDCNLTTLEYNGYLIPQFNCSNNSLNNLSFITTYDELAIYDFTYNYLPDSELNRLRLLGFTNESALVPQKEVILSDLDILRQIRDANPTSQLPSLWGEDKDPYTQWWDENNYKGALFGSDTRIDQFASIIGFTVPPIGDRNPYKVYVLNLSYTSISALPSVNKLSNLLYINCFGNLLLTLDVSNSFILRLECGSNQIATLNMSNVPTLQKLIVSHNELVSIPTLTSKGLITNYSFLYNNMPPNETDRLISLGFTSDQVLPQNL